MRLTDRITTVRYTGKPESSLDEYLTVDSLYEVYKLCIGESSSTLVLKDFPEHEFSVSLFEEIKDLHMDIEELAEEIELYSYNCDVSYHDVLAHLQDYFDNKE